MTDEPEPQVSDTPETPAPPRRGFRARVVDPLFAFDHKNLTTSLDGIGTSCGACHQPSYCIDCHDSGAINVHHDEMLYSHAQSMRLANGPKACAVCHQPAYCAQCHKGDARLGPSNSRLDGLTAEVGR